VFVCFLLVDDFDSSFGFWWLFLLTLSSCRLLAPRQGSFPIEWQTVLHKLKKRWLNFGQNCMTRFFQLNSALIAFVLWSVGHWAFLSYIDTFCWIDFLDVLSGILQHPIINVTLPVHNPAKTCIKNVIRLGFLQNSIQKLQNSRAQSVLDWR